MSSENSAARSRFDFPAVASQRAFAANAPPMRGVGPSRLAHLRGQMVLTKRCTTVCDVFAAVALPVIDLRSLSPLSSGQSTAIFWPDPGYGDEFVKGMGALRPRP